MVLLDLIIIMRQQSHYFALDNASYCIRPRNMALLRWNIETISNWNIHTSEESRHCFDLQWLILYIRRVCSMPLAILGVWNIISSPNRLACFNKKYAKRLDKYTKLVWSCWSLLLFMREQSHHFALDNASYFIKPRNMALLRWKIGTVSKSNIHTTEESRHCFDLQWLILFIRRVCSMPLAILGVWNILSSTNRLRVRK